MRIVVTGLTGQVVSALIERAPRDVELIALGRPRLDLSVRDAVLAALRTTRCDVIINAAAYTAVDRAESEPDVAMRVNGDGAGYVAEIAAELRTPLLHLSTDYVFDGKLDRPYREEDATNPAGAYGRSKLVGEQRIARIHANHVILRTAWVYGPSGTNFVRTMLRLGQSRDEIGVVADQLGNPTSALDIADALLTIARRVVADSTPALRGVFHMAGAGEASWAAFAEAIFAEAEKHGRPPVRVRKIGTAEYPTPAPRPANSRLDGGKLLRVHGVALPPWRQSLAPCITRLLATETV
ncbi:dTDP-4-dehydrorhamnose reductase [Rhodoblastus acidophilus]|uniref:dTDP-4-dehydrorhamnose reductase n=1 Tax=Candidatus Rhodoblastus alkanivorans TaxID=2954117 RepID=A0ABS9Z6E9_9HYPH|nr:dTDP-4-dehydrorhamnose reductase [Candidatus Rhodoblastus alkanivorans]MCI4679176.1 dTDP-4-dehydrorhamnose reductase [Candidatus Rhodoblastus alkanivorans]MCI4683172.1 dTDP-4-dehydrorhamnose reductase [Candidatus Rhodoblastus alkanivorans]MDI4640484.1 dTDP-4-dehydrorhamnose reductase [Rhodoblastus acidophilus]